MRGRRARISILVGIAALVGWFLWGAPRWRAERLVRAAAGADEAAAGAAIRELSRMPGPAGEAAFLRGCRGADPGRFPAWIAAGLADPAGARPPGFLLKELRAPGIWDSRGTGLGEPLARMESACAGLSVLAEGRSDRAGRIVRRLLLEALREDPAIAAVVSGGRPAHDPSWSALGILFAEASGRPGGGAWRPGAQALHRFSMERGPFSSAYGREPTGEEAGWAAIHAFSARASGLAIPPAFWRRAKAWGEGREIAGRPAPNPTNGARNDLKIQGRALARILASRALGEAPDPERIRREAGGWTKEMRPDPSLSALFLLVAASQGGKASFGPLNLEVHGGLAALREAAGDLAGSFPPRPGPEGAFRTSRIYATAVAELALSLQHRYLGFAPPP